MIEILRTEKELYLLGDEALRINTDTMDCEVMEKENVTAVGERLKAEHVFGAIKLLSGYFLVYVSQRCKVCTIPTSFLSEKTADIFHAERIEVLPFVDDQLLKLSEEQRNDEKRYLQLLITEFNLKPQSFYMTNNHEFDLTRSIQSQAIAAEGPLSLWDLVDEAFAWNSYLMEPFLTHVEKKHLSNWFTPLMRGRIQFNSISIGDERLGFMLMSKLSWKRVGTRHNCRGVNHEGFVANFVETEQVVSFQEKLFSYVEIRGSIPLLWSQTPNLAYKPPVVINHEQSTDAFQKHAKFLLKRYKRVTWINLVDQKGSEKKLADEFERQNRELNDSNSKYVAFDFHKQTKGMKYERISILISQISEDLKEYGFFHYDGQKIASRQEGVPRVNCIDSLDRTNVVQSVIGKLILVEQLKKLNLLDDDAKDFESIKGFGKSFKLIWADNGDSISYLYAGTHALKGDFTRTGKRSLIGQYYDFVASAKRYFFNNFTDGVRQDAINLMLGKFKVDPKKESPFKAKGVGKHVGYFFFGSFFVSIGLFAYHFFKTTQGVSPMKNMSLSVSFLVCAVVLYKALTKGGLGSKVVCSPKLE